MACGDRKKFSCGKKWYATCVFYEGYLPEYSELLNEDCVTTFETTEELYKTQENILEEIDLSNLGNNCITYDFAADENDIKVNEALYQFEHEICELKAEIGEKEGSGFENCSLDYGDLLDPCNEVPNITNQCEFNQFVIDKLIELSTT